MPTGRRLLCTLALASTAGAALVFSASGTASAQVGGSNGLIAYDQFRAADPGAAIWTVDPATSVEKKVSGSNYNDDQPAVSPNGKLIAFRHGGGIWTMTITGANRHKLTGTASTLSNPSWSPNGKQLVYLDNNHVGVMNANGTNRHIINSDDDRTPRWSPNGKKIAFSSYRVGDTVQLFTMNTNGTGVVDLTNNLEYQDVEPDWSPDSTHLLVSSNRPSTSGNNEIWMMAADGTGAQPLTADVSGAHFPAFSPDGQSFAYSGNNNGIGAVFVQSIAGGPTTTHYITDEPTNSGDENESWQPKYTTAINLNPTSGHRSSSVTVNASGYGFGEILTVKFKASGGVVTSLGTVTATSTGTASKVVRVPSGAHLGTGSFSVTGGATGRTASKAFNVSG